jgi:adenine deaminase
MKPSIYTVSGNIVDVVRGRIFKGVVTIQNGKIAGVEEKEVKEGQYILPGLIDAHIHIESSMLIPSEFARLAVVQGTVATVSDPHEIANVLGVDGVEFMIRNGNRVPFKFYFGASSCVPATPFETAGASLDIPEIEYLLNKPEIKYLSEMMNFPGVLNRDPEVMAKLELARKAGKPVDGHAPGLRGEEAGRYISAGISTDHECFTLEEARDKIRFGMKVLIREGSAARNFDDLAPLIAESPQMVMFCSDDRHPDDLVQRHMNDLVKRALSRDYDPIDVIRCCTLNPVRHYNLEVGLLQQDDPADFIVIDSLEEFNILETYVNGDLVAESGKSLIPSVREDSPNKFNARMPSPEDITVIPEGKWVKVIEAIDGQLITHELEELVVNSGQPFEGDIHRDILKMVVLNRYEPALPAVGFIHNFGLKSGAIASTVAHDSHNIIAVGASDKEILHALNALISTKGGVCCVHGDELTLLPLPVAGLMSGDDGYEVAKAYEKLTRLTHDLGSELRSPFMTLSFMALLVIPELKLSDRGLFDGKSFNFAPLFST